MGELAERHVMLPANKGPDLEVVEPDFPLHLLEDLFDAVPLGGVADKLREVHTGGGVGEVVPALGAVDGLDDQKRLADEALGPPPGRDGNGDRAHDERLLLPVADVKDGPLRTRDRARDLLGAAALRPQLSSLRQAPRARVRRHLGEVDLVGFRDFVPEILAAPEHEARSSQDRAFDRRPAISHANKKKQRLVRCFFDRKVDFFSRRFFVNRHAPPSEHLPCPALPTGCPRDEDRRGKMVMDGGG